MIAWLALLCAILCNAAGNVFIKQSSLTTELQPSLSYLNPWFILGVAFFGINVLLYSWALRAIPLVVAYPILVGVSVSLVAIIAVFFFKERFGVAHAAGTALVMLGVSCLAWAEWRS